MRKPTKIYILWGFGHIHVRRGVYATANKQQIKLNIYIYNSRLFGFEGPYVPCGLFASHASEMVSLSNQNQACRADWCNKTFLPASTLEDSIVMNNVGESIHLIVMNHPGHGTCIPQHWVCKKCWSASALVFNYNNF